LEREVRVVVEKDRQAIGRVELGQRVHEDGIVGERGDAGPAIPWSAAWSVGRGTRLRR